MAKFRKKPIVIEAEQFWPDGPDAKPLPFADQQACAFDDEGWFVMTAHGHRTPIKAGDWIIPEPDSRGFYPCKPDIFDATYEPVASDL
jgi:hypothetical protein